MTHGITQCYFPHSRCNSPAFTPAKLVLDLVTAGDARLTYLSGWLLAEIMYQA